MNLTLENKHKERLRSNGLNETTSSTQKSNGRISFKDPQTNATYIFSPKGYAWRKSSAGTYQLNPRFFLSAAVKGKRKTRATVRTTDVGAQVELVLKGVKSFRLR